MELFKARPLINLGCGTRERLFEWPALMRGGLLHCGCAGSVGRFAFWRLWEDGNVGGSKIWVWAVVEGFWSVGREGYVGCFLLKSNYVFNIKYNKY